MFKRKFFPILALSLIAITSFCSSAKEGYHIKVNVSGVQDTTSLLAYYFGDKQYVQDTVYIDGEGNFEFVGEEKLDRGMYMIVLPENKFFDIIIDKNQHFEIRTNIEEIIKNIKFINSPQNQSFYNYLKEIEPIGESMLALREKIENTDTNSEEYLELQDQYKQQEEKMQEIKEEYISSFPDGLFTAVLKAQEQVPMPEPQLKADGTPDRESMYNQYLEDYWKNIDLTDERLIRTPIYNQKLEHFFKSVVIQIPDSIISAADKLIEKTRDSKEMFQYTVWFVMNLSDRSNVMGMDALFVHMAENYYNTDDAFWVSEEQKEKIAKRAETLKPLLIGAVAPDIEVFTPEKNTKSLHEVDAKYTVLYFWDSECSHCKKVTPALHEVYEKIEKKGLEVFAMNVEMDREKWLDAVDKYELSWINVHDPANQSGFRDIYDIYSIPIMYVLDKDKKILAKKINPEQLEDLINHLESKN